MNISNIIIQIQRILREENDPLTALTLAKSIQNLEVGNVNVVSTIGDLPTLPLSVEGELYLVEDDEDLYYNIGSEWVFLPVVIESIAYSWGVNEFGKLGDGTTTNKSSPVTVIGGISNWKQVSAGLNHGLGVTENGIAYGWGGGGSIGNNSNLPSSSPAMVSGGIENWKQVSAYLHSLAVTEEGIAYSWGAGNNGVLGDGTTITKSSPVTVIGGITNWKQVSAGQEHSLGITESGIAYAWGRNTNFQLGDLTNVNKSSPITVVGGITNWKQVSAGYSHSLGLTETGILYAWGRGTQGKLGDGTAVTKSSPVTVVGGITNWKQVSASYGSTAITENGIAYAWGGNYFGRIGDGTTDNRSSPVTVIGGITNWKEVSDFGFNSAIGVTEDGKIYAWGSNSDGVLGDGTTINRSSPILISGDLNSWMTVSGGRGHAIAILSSGRKTL